ncbi:MAG: hypothetical protein ABFD96_15825 [Armatimonadia bacterium]
MDNLAIVISLVAELVLLTYAVEWLWSRRRKRALPLGQDPLRVLGVALGRLWRQRTLLLILTGFWIGSQLVAHFVTEPLIYEPQRQLARARQELPREDVQPVDVLLAGCWGAMASGRTWLWASLRGLPRVEPMSKAPDALTAMALYLALALGYWHLWRSRPEWLGRARSAPLGTFAILSATAFVLVVWRQWLSIVSDGGRPGPVLSAAGHAIHILVLVATVPLTGALWCLLLQVVREGSGSWALAVRRGLVAWRPLFWFMLLIYFTLLPALICPGLVRLVNPLLFVYETLRVPPTVLLFVPLLIVERQMGLWEATRRHFRMVLDNWLDITVFALRMMAFMLPVGLLLLPIGFGRIPGWFGVAEGVLGNAVVFLTTAWVAGWFEVLRHGEAKYLAERRAA